MKDQKGTKIDIGDKVVCGSARSFAPSVYFKVGEVVGFTKTMVKVEAPLIYNGRLRTFKHKPTLLVVV